MFIVRAIPPDAMNDAEIIDLERRIAAYRAPHSSAQPTLGELVGSVVEGTDFLGDIDIDRDPHVLAAVAANAAEAARELWEEEHGWPLHGVSLALIQDVAAALIKYANDLFAAEHDARVEAQLDAIEAGDLYQDSEPISHPRYRSV